MKLAKKLLVALALLVAPGLAMAQTATPTSTATFNPYVVGLSGFNLQESTELPKHSLGIPYFGKEGIYLYVKATVTVTDGQWVVVDGYNNATLLDNSAAIAASVPLRTCVVTADADTDTPYVWSWCGGGVFKALVTSGVSAGVVVTTTAVDGTVGTGGIAVNNCVTVVTGASPTRTDVRCADFAKTYTIPPTPAATTTP